MSEETQNSDGIPYDAEPCAGCGLRTRDYFIIPTNNLKVHLCGRCQGVAKERAEAKANELPSHRRPRQRVTEKTKIALLAYIEAARYVKKPDLQAFATKSGVKYETLKQTVYRWRRGLIDLGETDTPEQRVIDTKVEMMRTMDLVSKGEQFLNDMFEGVQSICRHEAAKGNYNAWWDQRADRLVSALLQIARLRETKEKGFLAILENAQQSARALSPQAQAEEKKLNAKVIDVAPRVARATAQQTLEAVFAEPA